MKHLNIKICGKVQGVFFRVSTKEKADELGLVGFVKNENDGTVYVEVEGEEENVSKFLEWCKVGADHAKVENIEIGKGDLKNYKSFDIV